MAEFLIKKMSKISRDRIKRRAKLESKDMNDWIKETLAEAVAKPSAVELAADPSAAEQTRDGAA
jgi:hypothetical protein